MLADNLYLAKEDILREWYSFLETNSTCILIITASLIDIKIEINVNKRSNDKRYGSLSSSSDRFFQGN